MSTYSTISGTVTLDVAAAGAFRNSVSWQWFEQRDDDHGPRSFSDGDGVTRLVFDGTLQRNLCRYLAVDLYEAQRFGAVWGAVTDDCNDGCNVRTVVRFSGRDCIVGTADCFAETIHASDASVVELVPARGDDPGIYALVETRRGPVTVLDGGPATNECWCTVDGGEPRCPGRARRDGSGDV